MGGKNRGGPSKKEAKRQFEAQERQFERQLEQQERFHKESLALAHAQLAAVPEPRPVAPAATAGVTTAAAAEEARRKQGRRRGIASTVYAGETGLGGLGTLG